MAAIIGIKIANGEFYPITEEYSLVKKRLILTTVHDDQKSAQIDLYRSESQTMADAYYIGSLLMENIRPRPRGEPSIELILTSTSDGNIGAEARDLDPNTSVEHQSLYVSLKSLDEDSRGDDFPDFELDTSESVPKGLYEKAESYNKEEKRKFPWLFVICAALILTALGLTIWLLLLRNNNVNINLPRISQEQNQTVQAPPTPPPSQPSQPATPPATPAPQPAQPATPPPVIPSPEITPPPPVIQSPVTPPPAPPPASRTRNPPVASYRVPTVIPREGAPYTIRWGDTLWDIAQAFYRNPWLYPQIARFNNIPNPDRIIAGRTIRVPPRN